MRSKALHPSLGEKITVPAAWLIDQQYSRQSDNDSFKTMDRVIEHRTFNDIDVAIIYSGTRCYDEAIGQVRKILEMEPSKGGFKGYLMEV